MGALSTLSQATTRDLFRARPQNEKRHPANRMAQELAIAAAYLGARNHSNFRPLAVRF